jgi:hypothetical protein
MTTLDSSVSLIDQLHECALEAAKLARTELQSKNFEGLDRALRALEACRVAVELLPLAATEKRR